LSLPHALATRSRCARGARGALRSPLLPLSASSAIQSREDGCNLRPNTRAASREYAQIYHPPTLPPSTHPNRHAHSLSLSLSLSLSFSLRVHAHSLPPPTCPRP
jgi:hypothetical protein